MILLDVARALYYIFKFFFCSWKKEQEEYDLEYFIKDNQIDNTQYFQEVKRASIRRSLVKVSTQNELIQQVDIQWAKIQESVGKYGKIIDFIATQRPGIHQTLLNVTKGEKRLDLIEKYQIFKSLYNQISELKKKKTFQQRRVAALKASYIKEMKTIPKEQFNYNIQDPLIPVSQKQQPFLESNNNSFEELQLEDNIDDMFLKWSVSRDLLDQFYQYGPGNSEMFQPNILLKEVVEYYKTEITNLNKETQFEQYLKEFNEMFTQEDLKYINKVKEIIYKSEFDDYEKKINEKQEELLNIKEAAAHKILSLENEANEIKLRLKEAGKLERIEESPFNANESMNEMLQNDEQLENWEIVIEQQQIKVEEAHEDIKKMRAEREEEDNRNREFLDKMQKELEETKRIIMEQMMNDEEEMAN